MKIQENVPLAPQTTLGVGGAARFFIEAENEKDIVEVIAFARKRNFPLYVFGSGSNVLVPDAGIAGVVLKIAMNGITIEDADANTMLIADAGASWDAVVDEAGARALFGIENLAGIPGTAGAAVVQNIGAYGAELSEIFEYADVLDARNGVRRRIMREEAAFAYRSSFFKQHPELIIVKVALMLTREAAPNLSYTDVARASDAGVPLTTPAEIARAIRAIRAAKFPFADGEGTAGSFFKNPVVTGAAAAALSARHPGLPVFKEENGQAKLSLAWLLDHGLSLSGYSNGTVRLYENQPLVFVARRGATARDVEALARDVAARVQNAFGITVEREVETFGSRTASPARKNIFGRIFSRLIHS